MNSFQEGSKYHEKAQTDLCTDFREERDNFWMGIIREASTYTRVFELDRFPQADKARKAEGTAGAETAFSFRDSCSQHSPQDRVGTKWNFY